MNKINRNNVDDKANLIFWFVKNSASFNDDLPMGLLPDT